MSRPPFLVGPLTPWFERSLDDTGRRQLEMLRRAGYKVTGFARTSRGPFTARIVSDPDGKGVLTIAGVGSTANEAMARLVAKVTS